MDALKIQRQKRLALVFVMTVVSLLGGCGQKGSLYLPDESSFSEAEISNALNPEGSEII